MTSMMLTEAREAPQAVARLLAADTAVVAALAQRWQAAPPRGLLTLARGSSDHAAQYMAYLTMARMGRPVTSLPLSLFTLHGAALAGKGLGALAFSQSGQSPDLLEPTRALRQAGADTVAVVNDSTSPLAQAAEWLLPLHAGPERSVAATKSFIAQLVVGARLLAAWAGDVALAQALAALPAVLDRAAAQDWSTAVEALRAAGSVYVIGRGAGLAVAQEAALKFKETCGVHAEAFSSAEVQHGPMALVSPGFPMLVLAPRGPEQPGLLALAQAMRDRGACVLLAAPDGTPDCRLPLQPASDERLDPISAIQSFYPMVEALARARGRDPDLPQHLTKVTRTR